MVKKQMKKQLLRKLGINRKCNHNRINTFQLIGNLKINNI